MDDQKFQTLAMKVAGGEATTMEIATLNSLMAEDPARYEQFHAIQKTMEIFRDAALLTEALQRKTPELPAYRMNELQSAVRREFQTRSYSSIWARWLGRFSFKTAFAGSAVIVALVCWMIFFVMPAREIEIGMFKGFATRGTAGVTAVSQRPHMKVVLFQKEEDFEKWQGTSLSRNQKAKIWIDEETGTIRVLCRGSDGRIHETTTILVENPKLREQQLAGIVRSIQDR